MSVPRRGRDVSALKRPKRRRKGMGRLLQSFDACEEERAFIERFRAVARKDLVARSLFDFLPKRRSNHTCRSGRSDENSGDEVSSRSPRRHPDPAKASFQPISLGSGLKPCPPPRKPVPLTILLASRLKRNKSVIPMASEDRISRFPHISSFEFPAELTARQYSRSRIPLTTAVPLPISILIQSTPKIDQKRKSVSIFRKHKRKISKKRRPSNTSEAHSVSGWEVQDDSKWTDDLL